MISPAIFWSNIAQFVRILSSLYTIPVCLQYLGKERYGLWMTILSIYTLAGFFDFGYTFYLRNKLNEAYTRGKKKLFQKLFFHGCIQGVVCGILVFLFTCTLLNFDLETFFKVKTTFLKKELYLTIVYLGILTVILLSTGVLDNYICITTNMINYRKIETALNLISVASLIIAINYNLDMPILAAIVYSPLVVLKVLS